MKMLSRCRGRYRGASVVVCDNDVDVEELHPNRVLIISHVRTYAFNNYNVEFFTWL